MVLRTVVFAGVLCLSVVSAKAAEVIYVQGAVQMAGSGSEEWGNLETGMRLKGGERIRTARRGAADIALDEARDNIVRVAANTLILMKADATGVLGQIDLSRGTVYAKIEGLKSGQVFEVMTPSSVVGVRGTAFRVVSSSSEDEISAYEESVYLNSFGADKKAISQMRVLEGFKTTAERFKQPGQLKNIPGAEIRAWEGVRKEMLLHAGTDISQRPVEPVGVGPVQQVEEQMGEQAPALEGISDAKDQVQDRLETPRAEESHSQSESHEW